MSDATETKNRTAGLRKRVSELERETAKLRADISDLRKLTIQIGHDFNNVLQGMTSKVERFADNESDRAQELSETILASASRGADLTDKLLSIGHKNEAAEPDASGTIEMPKDYSPAKSSSSAKSAQILLVEDQEPIREFTRALLAKAGYEVAVAANGAEAVAAVRDADFALVLMDVHMPVMNGLTATQKIRKLTGPRSKVPIIAISGNVPLQHVQSLMAAGMNDHIAKPFKKSALLHKVDICLNRPNPTILPPPVPSAEKPERTTFDDACELMGRPWAMRGLTKLSVQIDQVFGAEPGIAHDDEQLAGQAHALVSLAALLGFSLLSERCSTLEEACRSGRDVRLPFEQAKAAALQARKDAADLLAGR